MWYGAWVVVPTHTSPGLECVSQNLLTYPVQKQGTTQTRVDFEAGSTLCVRVVVVALHRALLRGQMILQSRPLLQPAEQEQTSH